MVRNLRPRYLLILLAADNLIVTAALLGSWWLRLNLAAGASIPEAAVSPPLWLFIATGLIWIFGLAQAGVYRPYVSRWTLLRRLISGQVVASLLFLGMIYLTYRDYSRLQALYLIGLIFGGLLLHRGVIALCSSPVSQQRRVLIIGTDAHARQVGTVVKAHDWARLKLVGYIQADSSAPVVGPVLGDLADLDKVITAQAVDEVFISLGRVDETTMAQMAQWTQRLQAHPVNIRLAPDYAELAYFHLSAEDFGGIPLIGVRYDILSPAQMMVKRLFDITLALVILLLAWPLFGLIMLAIRLDSPGAAIFQQRRLGQYGRPFNMLKFRTMYTQSPPPNAPHPQKQPADPRVTRVGRFLRRTSLDELPQFINVLRGEMSIVGPRPELPEYVEKYAWWQRKRFEMPQGITGWWQINGRAERPMFENTEDDLYYIRHYSLWLDVQIVLRTVLVVFTGRGAY